MKIIFLTNNQNSQNLINWLRDVEREEVIVWSSQITQHDILKHKPDFLISYNYRFIIKKEVLDLLPNRAINLHISLLPYNRGAHPNVWSFLEDTPKGVSIHLIDKGLDTGDILVQKEIKFDADRDTLVSTYESLHQEIQELFKSNWSKIKKQQIKSKKQPNRGSTHATKEFDKIRHILGKKGWNISIRELKNRYKSLIDK